MLNSFSRVVALLSMLAVGSWGFRPAKTHGVVQADDGDIGNTENCEVGIESLLLAKAAS